MIPGGEFSRVTATGDRVAGHYHELLGLKTLLDLCCRHQLGFSLGQNPFRLYPCGNVDSPSTTIGSCQVRMSCSCMFVGTNLHNSCHPPHSWSVNLSYPLAY